ncbi:MAG: (Fe-S)-binding protein [bacterium]
MGLDSKALYAIGNLGVHFWIHVFRRIFKRPAPGSEMRKFNEYYAEDLLVPLKPADRDELIGYERCINCGMCVSVCPVYPPSDAGSYRAPDSIAVSLSRSYPEFGSTRDSIYNCAQCGACARACSRGIDIPALVMLVRRKAMEIKDPKLMKIYGPSLERIAAGETVYGPAEDTFEDFKKEKADIVYFAGCGGRSLTPKATRKVLEFLRALGIDFTTIDERCAGCLHQATGAGLGDYAGVAANIEAIRAAGARKVIVSDPHVMEIMKRHSPYSEAFEVVHITEFLAGIPFKVRRAETPLAYHDPCFLGRRGGVFEAPRELIRRLGTEPIELKHNRTDALCCGSAEGTFILDAKVADGVTARRLAEARESGAQTLLTECPACVSAFKGAATAGLQIYSLAEYLADHYTQSG